MLNENSKRCHIKACTLGNKCKFGLFLLFCVIPQNIPFKKIQWLESKHGKLMSFFLSFVKNSKRHTCDIAFLNRIILILNRDDHNPEFWHKFASPTF